MEALHFKPHITSDVGVQDWTSARVSAPVASAMVGDDLSAPAVPAHAPHAQNSTSFNLAMQAVANQSPESTPAAAAKQVDASPQKTATPEKFARTTGLKAFDVFLYPFFTNFGVMAISIVFTYLTSRGNSRLIDGEIIHAKPAKFNFQHAALTEKLGLETLEVSTNQLALAKLKRLPRLEGSIHEELGNVVEKGLSHLKDGVANLTPKQLKKETSTIERELQKVFRHIDYDQDFKGKKLSPEEMANLGKPLFGKFANFFQRRGDWMVGKLESIGLNHEQADVAKMVTFSFLDGSLMAPFVKLFEDRREDIGRSIDSALGTKPKDDSVYKAEPKQSWLSVLGGRLATVSIVVPVAVILDRTKINGRDLNTIMFQDPGLKLGKYISKEWPKFTQRFAKYDVPELFKIGVFEAFYTSVCTAGLYFSSRFFAGAGSRKEAKNLEAQQKVEKANEILANAPVNDGVEMLRGNPQWGKQFDASQQKQGHAAYVSSLRDAASSQVAMN